MALVQIEYPTSLAAQADFSAHGDLIEAGLWDKVNNPLLVQGGNIPQGAVLQIGSVIFHGTTATAITGTASDYVRVTDNGDGTASAEYVATLTGVTWSAQYNGYYDGTGRLYIFDEGKALKDSPAITALLTRYVTRTEDGDTYIGRDLDVGRNATVGGTLGVTGKVTAAAGTTTSDLVRGDRTITAGTGLSGGGNLSANRTINMVNLMNQNVRTTDGVTFSTVNARGIDTFGGFHRGTGDLDTDLPIGSLLIAYRGGDDGTSLNGMRTVYRDVGNTRYTLDSTKTGVALTGTWRSRGLIFITGMATADFHYLMQRTA